MLAVLAALQAPLPAAAADPGLSLTPIWAIVIVMILREVFGFLVPVLNRHNGRNHLTNAITSIAETLDELRRMHAEQERALAGLAYGQQTIREDTKVLRDMGHQANTHRQQVVNRLETLAQEVHDRRGAS